MFEAMTIGERLRYVLEVRKVKQLHLAEKLGLQQSTISNIVTDASRKPSAPTLLLLCEELRCSPSWLITGKGDPWRWMPVTEERQVELLTAWREMSEDSRRILLDMARQLAKTPS